MSQVFQVRPQQFAVPLDPAVADFIATPVSGTTPLLVQFTFTGSGDALSFEWDFEESDTTQSTLRNPSFTYQDAGTFNVALTVTNTDGSDTITKINFIEVASGEITGDWTSVGLGVNSSTGIKSDGTLWSWGSNLQGQTGQGVTTGATSAATQIGVGIDWEEIQSGTDFSIAKKSDGTIWSWGLGTNGRTGHGDTTARNVPTQIGTDTDWNKISVGANFVLAVKTDGTLWSWGAAAFGKLGNGTSSPDVSVPTQVGSDSNWSKISTGGHGTEGHSLALKTDGTLWSWGQGRFSKTGQGSTADVTAPTQVGTDTNWSEISAGNTFSSAIKNDGTRWGWGNNGNGQLGNGTTATGSSTPTQSGIDTDWQKVESGGSTTDLFGLSFGIKTNGEMYSWGSGAFGLLGVGNGPNPNIQVGGSTSTPVKINDDTNWLNIFMGKTTTAGATKNNNSLWTWGVNSNYRTGYGFIEGTRTIPSNMDKIEGEWDKVYVNQSNYISAGQDPFALGIKNNGTLWGWGSNAGNAIGISGTYRRMHPVLVSSDTWIELALSYRQVVGIKSDGTLWGWGNNEQYLTGQGINTGITSAPTQIGMDSNWIQVINLINFAIIALKSDGTLWSWGNNVSGITGQGSTSGTTNNPTQIGTDTDWVEIGGRYQSAFAIKTNGTLYSWGSNNSGGTGLNTDTGSTDTPTQVGSATDWATVQGGFSFGVGIKTNGELWSWGDAGLGKLGNGTGTPNVLVPTQVGTDTDWSKLNISWMYTLALKTDSTLWSWGRTTDGVLGRPGSNTSPGQVTPPSSWKFIATGQKASIGVTTDNVLFTWGRGGSDEGSLNLGNINNDQTTPKQTYND